MTSHWDEALATLTSSTVDDGLSIDTSRGSAIVLVCSDVVRGKARAQFIDALESLVDSQFVGEVRVINDLCAVPSKLSNELNGSGTERVIVACRYGASVRDEVKSLTRRLAIHPAGVVVLGLTPGPRVSKRAFVEHSIVQIHAALASVFSSDLVSPYSEGRSSAAKRYSRRNLFHPGDIARPLIATWTGSRCHCAGRRRACVDACHFGALTLVGSRILVDSERCTSCGGCLGTCPSAALSIGGVTVSTLEEVVKILVSESLKLDPRPGLAITCEHAATRAALGGEWLPLDVSSLETVSVGWPLQLLASGVSVRLAGCSQARCGSRARDIVDLCHDLVETSIVGGLVEPRFDVGRDALCAELRFVSSSHSPVREGHAIRLREPEATVSALSFLSLSGDSALKLTALSPRSETADRVALDDPVRVESAFSPMGQVSVEGDRCSACGSCTLACPTGALSRGEQKADKSSFVLTLDPMACSACGACVPLCPEHAITLRHVIDSSTFQATRKVVARIDVKGHCSVCGSPLVGGLAPSTISGLLAESHPQLAHLLLQSDKCVDCTLS